MKVFSTKGMNMSVVKQGKSFRVGPYVGKAAIVTKRFVIMTNVKDSRK